MRYTLISSPKPEAQYWRDLSEVRMRLFPSLNRVLGCEGGLFHRIHNETHLKELTEQLVHRTMEVNLAILYSVGASCDDRDRTDRGKVLTPTCGTGCPYSATP